MYKTIIKDLSIRILLYLKLQSGLLLLLLFVNQAEANKKEYSILTGNGRSKINLNRDWKFSFGNIVGIEEVDFDDNGWAFTGLPHSFSTPYFMSSEFYEGYGCYRRHLEMPKEIIGKKYVALEFEGVFQQAEIFVNGRLCGKHSGGYTGFTVDISGAVKQGDNIIAVRVNNLWNPGLAPRAGEHVFSGGIYRDVYLTTAEPVHVAWYGTFIKTPSVNKRSATLEIETTITNTLKTNASCTLITEIFSPDKRKVFYAETSKVIKPQSVVNILQTGKPVPGPMLWDVDHPFLYKTVSTIMVNGQKKDEYTTTFGIRDIRWTADSGFFLNGRSLYLRGANVHQDHAGWGDAVSNKGFYRDVSMIKEAGFNFIRGSHYPHDPAFVEACDRLGLLYWSENVFWGIGGGASTPENKWISSAYPSQPESELAFEASLQQQLQEMILIHRNNPSIIAWSMCNEPFFTVPASIEKVRKLLFNLVKLAHQLDNTRPAAIGGAQRPLDSFRIDKIGDIAGYNGDGGSLPEFYNPGIPNIVSEYGSVSAERPGEYAPGWGDISMDSGKHVHRWRSGQAIWAGFDHGSVAGARLGKMGIIDYFRIPKRSWYWYRNAYRNVPAPQWPTYGTPTSLKLIASSLIAESDGTDDILLTINVVDSAGNLLSNSPDVKLKILSGPGEFPTGRSISFDSSSDITIRDGQAAIEVRSWQPGKTLIEASSPGLASTNMTIEFIGEPPSKQVSSGVEEKAYKKFTGNVAKKVNRHYGQNNPVFASSFILQHSPGLCADGKENTWWQPSIDDNAPSIWIDTEKKLLLDSITIVFPVKDIYRFVLEVSENGKEWRTVKDYLSNSNVADRFNIDTQDIPASLVRLRFINSTGVKLSEIDLSGYLAD